MVAVSEEVFLLFIMLLGEPINLQLQIEDFLLLFFGRSGVASVVLKDAAEKLVGLSK